MLLEIRNGTASQKGNVVLSQFDFEIRGTEKIAVVGRNGAGKSTLLSVLAGEKALDRDDRHPEAGLFCARQLRTLLVRQTAVTTPERTVEELLREDTGSLAEDVPASVHRQETSEEADAFELRFRKLFTGLGFLLEDRHRKLGSFSGGEQTKIMLLRAFLLEPDVLLLDEPTNHLDLAATEWLEQQVRQFHGAVVYVSHDRYFIDRTADVVYEVSGGKTVRYTGGYTQYRSARAQRYEKQLRAYEAQQEEIRRLNGLIEKFRHKPRKAAFARSRVKILERMEKVDPPRQDDAVIHAGEILPARPGNREVFECEHLRIGYDRPLHEISLRIRRGQKIGVFGPNGSGKTTFLKTVAGILPPYGGASPDAGQSLSVFRMGEHIDLAYFDQMSANFRDERNVFDYFHDAYPALSGEEERSWLAGYLFRGEDLGKTVSNLSGGEKVRLCLAKILMDRPNFLILDEPTNNMDIPAMETLESIFRDYKGTILFSSHDRYFLSHVADALLLFPSGDEPVRYYPFGYDKYKEREDRAARGMDASLLRTAEEQRLIEGLRSVPKKEAHERPLSTAEAAIDWEYSLNEKERIPAEEAFAEADARTLLYPETEEEYEHYEEILAARQAAAETARAAWTKTLLDWYDIWLETH